MLVPLLETWNPGLFEKTLYFVGVGRDKRHPVTWLVDMFSPGAGGDYHTTYYPQPTYVSSRSVQGQLKVDYR